MPWDLIFYGSMAIIFIGIIVATSRARRDRNGGAAAGTVQDGNSLSDSTATDGEGRSD